MNFFRLPDGRRLSWREQGVGPALVLLHGWSMSSSVFTEAIAVLAKDYRVLAPDLRGHGASDAGAAYSLSDFSADLRLWLKALHIHRFNLLGWSMGGQVAIDLCRTSAGQIDRLILVGSTPCFAVGDDWGFGLPDLQIRTMVRNLKRNYLKTMENFFDRMFVGETLSAERHRQVVSFVFHGGRLPEPEVALAALETLCSADQRLLLAGIACPTLVMHGDRDVITLPDAGRYLAEMIPDARLSLRPGVSHVPFFSHPQEVFRQWREFLV
jgi:pimeloyl-[acyl-carrier protein] methyl ester esterase